MSGDLCDVIVLDERRPHKVDIVRCLQCKHEWVAVAPVTTEYTCYECPVCRCKGVSTTTFGGGDG